MAFSVKKTAWLVLGFVSLALGIVGIVLPVLPTTPFVLLASFCFLRSSKRLHQYLEKHRFFGKIIRNFRDGGGMTVKSKVILFLTVAAFIVPVMILADSPHLRLFLGLVLAVKAAVLFRLKTRPAEEPPRPDAASPAAQPQGEGEAAR